MLSDFRRKEIKDLCIVAFLAVSYVETYELKQHWSRHGVGTIKIAYLKKGVCYTKGHTKFLLV